MEISNRWMNDGHGRVIDYLRISVTDRCNLRCQYCMPEEGICKKSHSKVLRNEEIVQFVKVAADEGVRKIRLTGGEPLVRKGIVALVKDLSDIPGIEEIGMTTNGVLLNHYAKALKEAGLSRVNISLDSLDPNKYQTMTRTGILSEVIDGIKAAKQANLEPIKVNTVLIGGFNDEEIDAFMTFAKAYDLEWRVIELMPIGEVSAWSTQHFISGKTLFDEHPSLVRKNQAQGQRVKKYHHKSYGIEVGLIDALSGKFCETCNRLRLTADGHIKPCLHSDHEYDIRPYLANQESLVGFYNSCLRHKPKEHKIQEKDFKPVIRNMNSIGG